MGEETLDRKEFIGRVGTFFVLIGFFALMIFIATDISRSDQGQADRQKNTEFAAQAIATRDAGARMALLQNLPTPTLMRVKDMRATQEYIEAGVQALQTRDAGAQYALPRKWNTPTLVNADTIKAANNSIGYFSLFCIAALAISGGLILRRITAPPASKASGRFEGLRKMRQKQREAEEKRAAAKKEKEAKKRK
jgi:hypothetical protein